jgi:hypothetical protein
MKGLDQDSFNDDKKSKRSTDVETFENWNIDWAHSSSLPTLNGFKVDSMSFVNS